MGRRSLQQVSQKSQTTPGPAITMQATKPVVAYIKMSLHEDGDFTVSTSDHVKGCAGITDTQRLQRQIVKAHQMHLSSNPQIKEETTSQRDLRPSMLTTDPDFDSPETKKQLESIPPQMMSTFHPDDEQNDDDDDSEDDDSSRRPLARTVMHSFRIEQTDKVTEFLKSRLAHLQQGAVKRLAKAWIKGVCPKKQARFPYSDQKVIPGWWPATDFCPFKEPDHIKKDDRLNLCIHLLRLRPKLGDMRAWNDDQRMPHATYDFGGWTNFIKGVAPPDLVKDLREDEAVNERRTRYVKELYDIMQMEEDFLNDAIDGTDQFFWEEDPIDTQIEARATAALSRKLIRTKKAAAKAATSAEKAYVAPAIKPSTEAGPSRNANEYQHVTQTTFESNSDVEFNRPVIARKKMKLSKNDDYNPELSAPTATPSGKAQTRRKKAPTKQSSARQKRNHHESDDEYKPSASESSTPTAPTTSSTTAKTPTYAEQWGQAVATSTSDAQNTMMNTSFSSTNTSYCPSTTTDSFSVESSRMMPLASNTMTPMLPLHMSYNSQPCSAHMMTQLPYPNFRTLPNSPVTPHPSLLGIPMDHTAAINSSMQQHPWFAGTWPTSSFASTMYDHESAAMMSQEMPSSQPMIRHDTDGVYDPLDPSNFRSWDNSDSLWATRQLGAQHFDRKSVNNY